MGYQCMLMGYPCLKTGVVLRTNTDSGVHQPKGFIGEYNRHIGIN